MAASVFVMYSRKFHEVRIGVESLSRSQHVLMLKTHMNGLMRNHDHGRCCVLIKVVLS